MTNHWTIVLACAAIALAGCAAETSTPAAPAALSETSAAAEPAWIPAPMPMYALDGPSTTRAPVASYSVETFEETAVEILLDGTPVASDIVSGPRTWEIPLPPGRSELTVRLDGPSGSAIDARTLVRLVPTQVTIEYCRYDGVQPRTDVRELWIDVDARPAAPWYHEAGAAHPDLFSAHDQLRVFQAETGLPVNATYFEDFQGFLLDTIDDCPPAQAEGVPWWTLYVNGVEAAQGMSLQPVGPGDQVVWRMTPCA